MRKSIKFQFRHTVRKYLESEKKRRAELNQVRAQIAAMQAQAWQQQQPDPFTTSDLDQFQRAEQFR